MEIAASMKTITENIIASNDTRMKATANLIADVRSMLNGFSSDRKKTSDDQKEALNLFMKNLSDKVKNLLKEFQKNRKHMGEAQAKSLGAFVKNLDKEVNTLLASHHKEREEKFDDLKNKLAMEIDDIKTDVKKIINEADNLMSEYKDDIGKARNIWQDMSASLAETRGKGLTVGIKLGENNFNVEESLEKKKKKKMVRKKSMNEMKK